MLSDVIRRMGSEGEQLHDHHLVKGGLGSEHEERLCDEGEEDDVQAGLGLPLLRVGSHDHEHHGHREGEEEDV